MKSKPRFIPCYELPDYRHLIFSLVVAIMLLLAAEDYMQRVHTLLHLAILPIEICCGLTLLWVWFLNYFAFGSEDWAWRLRKRRQTYSEILHIYSPEKP